MKVVVFGATGMVGQGVLRECLLAPDVTAVVTVGRSATGRDDPKLREIVHADLFDLDPIRSEFADADACFFCLGVSSVGMSEADYRRVTYDLTMAAARAFPTDVVFTYVSGQGTDSNGSRAWAQVKGRTENDLMALLPRSYMFRPGYIHPMNGERPRSKWAGRLLPVVGVLYPVLRRLMPKSTTTTENLGRAMLHVARRGAAQRVLENPAINAAASS